MSCLFRSRIANAGSLSSNVLRIHARHPISSNISQFRGYATQKARPGIKISRPSPSPRPPPPPTTRQAPTRLPPANTAVGSRSKKIETAERLFRAGDTVLYKSTSRTTFFRVNSWALTLLAGMGAYLLNYSGLLDIKTFYDSGHKYPVIMIASYIVTFSFFGGVMALTMLRTRNHIHRIELIQQSGRVALQVTTRSSVPFMRKRFIVQPSLFFVDDSFPAVSRLPDSLIPVAPRETAPAVFVGGVIRETIKSISRSLYSFFDSFRAYFFRQGLLKILITQEGKKNIFTLDAGGEYLIQKEKIALWDVVETKDPYDLF